MEDNITPEDELKAENELLKLKLELEHGMLHSSDTSQLPADIQNQWLNYIYNYEKVCKDAGKIKVIDFVDNPPIKKINEIASDEISDELGKLLELLFTKDIRVDFICEYTDEIKYIFITEELLEEEFYNIRMEGMRHCFTYEEFHPNHDYDLRRHSKDFLNRVFNKKWSEDCAKYEMTKTVVFQGKEYDGSGISQIIFTFQEVVARFEIKELDITIVTFDMDEFKGYVKATASYIQYWNDGGVTEVNGDCHLHFVSEYGGWSLSGFSLPGLG
ncbi:MAG: hypothetical protein JWO03_1745 [Bacteroidetes bacterium]|nr:hypothetical protein [Bacteroidota bacterium]